MPAEPAADEASRTVSLEGTAYIAHELSSPVTGLLLGLDGIAATLRALHGGGASDLGHAVRRLEDQVTRTREYGTYLQQVIQTFRNLERGVVRVAQIDLHVVVERALFLASHQLDGRTSVSADLGHEPALICADETRLVQVVVNLLSNAAHSLRRGMHGHHVELRIAHVPSGIRLDVSDNGDGIPEAHLERVFEAGFTTKSDATGHGLGLPFVRSVVASLSGDVSIDSQEGIGTCVSIVLPRTDAEGADDEGGLQ